MHRRANFEVIVGNKGIGKTGVFLYRPEFVGGPGREHEETHRAVLDPVELFFDAYDLLLADLAPGGLQRHDNDVLVFGEFGDVNFFAICRDDFGWEFDIGQGGFRGLVGA